MTHTEVIKKKRGRKPKNYVNLIKIEDITNKIIEKKNSEEEKIIFH